jgi:hypothetical protein
LEGCDDIFDDFSVKKMNMSIIDSESVCATSYLFFTFFGRDIENRGFLGGTPLG